MKATVTLRFNQEWVTVTLDAMELPERRIACELSNNLKVVNGAGEEYSFNKLHVLSMSGEIFARRILGVPEGIKVQVHELRGFVEIVHEVGICHATSVAIARSLDKDETCLLENCSPWELE